MPYIERTRRPLLRPTSKVRPVAVGELTFQVSCLLEDFRRGHREAGPDDFATLAACKIAAIQAADEFQHQVIDPYEQAKRLANGPVHAPIRVRARPYPRTPGAPQPVMDTAESVNADHELPRETLP